LPQKLLNGEANLVGGKLLLDSIKISIVGGAGMASAGLPG
jgi:hypothetical protein